MWKQKLGISITKKYDIPMAEVIKMLKTIGFDAISPEWENYKALEEIVISAKENNMIVQSLHAPFMNASILWSTDENVSTPAKTEIIETIDTCAYEVAFADEGRRGNLYKYGAFNCQGFSFVAYTTWCQKGIGFRNAYNLQNNMLFADRHFPNKQFAYLKIKVTSYYFLGFTTCIYLFQS